jgi:hopanoid biosynthesis associated protein HpnK
LTYQSSIPCGTKCPAKRIIVTGDDLGLALPVNEAILDAHQKGILTTASLMTGEAFFQDAVDRARQHPSLKVGLHLTLVEGHPTANPRYIRDLVSADGTFSLHLARTGFKFFFRPGIRKQLETEIRAQFEAFHKTGLKLDHANAHNHMHLHPTVMGLMLRVGKDYGLAAVRLPYEPPMRSWKSSRSAMGSRVASSIFLLPWMNLMKHLLRQARVRHNNFFFGMSDSGSMTLDRILRIISHLPDGVSELGFHPATRRSAEIDRTMPGYHHEEEFLALTNESLRLAVQAAGIQRIAFSDL